MARPPHGSLRKIDLGRLDMRIEAGDDGAIHARSPFKLTPHDPHVTAWLDRWAARAPDRLFLAERMADTWRSLTYGETRLKVRALAQGLIARELSLERPLLILCGNGIEHALLALAASYVGIPYAPVSPAYRENPDKLARIVALLTPGLIFVEDDESEAIASVTQNIEILASKPAGRAHALSTLAQAATPALDTAHEAVAPDVIAKFMFTSGSTGEPKAVITTHRMLCANQAMIASYLRFLLDEPPVLLDWLPWHHSFGGNQNFNLTLCHGGTLYIDAGRPTPEGIETTLANVRAIAPTIHFNVPHGLDMLLPRLKSDKKLAGRFFSGLKLAFLAGAPIPRQLIEQFDDLALRTCGERILIMSGYGATETSPAALFCDQAASSSVGLPLPGTELKLAPRGEKMEARIRGPHVTPGYWRSPELTRRAFDEEGYYCLGDALRLTRESFCFDGRLDEDFKLATGAWVSVGPLRQSFIETFSPYVKDLALAGPGEAYLIALVFPDIEKCRELAGPGALGEVLAHPAVLAKFHALLDAFSRRARGSSDHIAKIALLPEPSAEELTAKGSLNQAGVRARRAALIRALYAGRRAAIEASPRQNPGAAPSSSP
ncbi:MAG TPA: AMP-binding protein [Methylovirgula sp.]|nr:AMP-binding protein [Methylovirgula sp.]